MSNQRRGVGGLFPVLLGVALMAGSVTGVSTAVAAPPELNLLFTQETGLDHFDIVLPGTQLKPGQDTGPDDEIIRTNDIITYQFAAGMPEGATDTVTSPWIEFKLPRGEQFVNLIDGVPSFTDTKGNYNVVPPAFCGPGSEISYTGDATTMPSPDHLGLTESSWESLPQQTLKCYLHDITPGQGVGFTLYTKVRPEVPHGTLLSDVHITINGEGIDPQPTVSLQHTVSSASKWDLSFNGSLPIGEGDNSDFVKQNTEQMCVHNYQRGTGVWQGEPTGNAGILCYNGGFTVTLSQPNAGLGGTAIQGGDFTYTLDLRPETIWSQPAKPGGKSIWELVQVSRVK